MTPRQRILKLAYPFILLYGKLTGKTRILVNDNNSRPSSPVPNFSIRLINGQDLSLNSLRGKKLLIVNTASNCGYTGQYEELQKLYQHCREELEIIAFPSNDFHHQEPSDNSHIEKFCRMDYGVAFPVAAKSVVLPGPAQNPLFHWLTSSGLNGWNEQPPIWNFTKYLLNEDGQLTHYFGPAVSPLSRQVIDAIHI